jgi:hypothetical protein
MDNKKRILYILCPALFMIFVALIPLMSILSDVVKVTSLLFFIIKILYVVILFLLLIVNTALLISLIKELFKQDDIKIFKKILLSILLVLFSIIIMPYIYNKYILKSTVKPYYLIIYFIAIIFLSFIFLFGFNIYNKKLNEEKQRLIELEKKRVTYTEKNNIFSYDFKTDYKTKEVGEYDLYVKSKDKNVIFTEFTYDTSLYEQKTLEDYLLKGVNDIESSKKNAKIYKDKKLTELEDKSIYEIIYEGQSDKSDPCIYRISVISFKSKPGYISYVVTVTLKEDYSSLKKEIDEIIKSVKIIQNE